VSRNHCNARHGILQRARTRALAILTVSALAAVGVAGSAGSAFGAPSAPRGGIATAAATSAPDPSGDAGGGSIEDPIATVPDQPLVVPDPETQPVPTTVPDPNAARADGVISLQPAALVGAAAASPPAGAASAVMSPASRASSNPATPIATAAASAASPQQISPTGSDGTNANYLSSFSGAYSNGTVSPPDTQLAVGDQSVVEMVNTEMRVYDRGGNFNTQIHLGTLFGASGSATAENKNLVWPDVTDPKIVFDPNTKRWFATAMVFKAKDTSSKKKVGNDGSVKVAVSGVDDPFHWSTAEVVAFTTNHVLLDQPKLAVNENKVVITDDVCGYNDNCTGGQTWVVDKQILLGLNKVVSVHFLNDAYGTTPAIQLSATPDDRQYEFHYRVGLFFSYVQTQYITGTPGDGNVHRVNAPGTRISDVNDPPAATQPQTKVKLDTGDDKIESAVYRDGLVWLASGDACKKGGKKLACLRLILLSVDDATRNTAPRKSQDVDLTRPGLNSFYPAVTMDANHDLIVSYSVSNDNVFAAPEELSLVNGASFANVVPQEYAVGQGPIGCGFCGRPSRFGDYSGVSADPANPYDVWVAAEWGSTSPPPAGWKFGDPPVGGWGTSIAHYSFASTTTTVCVLDYSGTNPLDGTGGCGPNQYPQIVQTNTSAVT